VVELAVRSDSVTWEILTSSWSGVRLLGHRNSPSTSPRKRPAIGQAKRPSAWPS
jgi:hypothetical protein